MLEIVDLMVGARNCVRGFAAVEPGEEILLVADRTGAAEDPVIEALAVACHEAGARVTTMVIDEFEPRVEEPPQPVANAVYGCSKVLWACKHEVLLHSRAGLRAFYDYGVTIIPIVTSSVAAMNSDWARFPMDVFWLIARKVFARVRASNSLRITSPSGTDFRAAIDPMHIVGLPVLIEPRPPIKGTCNHGMFPPGCCGLHPESPVEGRVVFDCLLGYEGFLDEPVVLTIKDHWVTGVSGGPEADWLKEMMDRNENGAYIAEVMFGLNPKASIERGLRELKFREGEITRRAGTLHVGLGNSIVLGGGVWSTWHWDGVLVRPFDLILDDGPLIENGRLLVLDDPEVVHAAEAHGSPEEVLSLTP